MPSLSEDRHKQAALLRETAMKLDSQSKILREFAFKIEMTPVTFVYINSFGPDGPGLFGGAVGIILNVDGDNYTVGFQEDAEPGYDSINIFEKPSPWLFQVIAVGLL